MSRIDFILPGLLCWLRAQGTFNWLVVLAGITLIGIGIMGGLND